MVPSSPPSSFGLQAPSESVSPLLPSSAWQDAWRPPGVWPNVEAQHSLPWVASAMEAASSRWSEARLWAVQQVWQLQQEPTVPCVLAPALSRHR